MNSVYDAAFKHAEDLKAELKSLQSYMDLHDHFREKFGFAAPAAAESSHEEEPAAEGNLQANPKSETPDAETPDAEAPDAETPDAETLEAHSYASAPQENSQFMKASEGVLAAAPGSSYPSEPSYTG